jgi:gamma-glutamyltranspeptidase/glutathione hydrolase
MGEYPREGLMRLGFIWLIAAGLAWGSQPYRARHALVVSGETHASEIGVRVLQAGGNAMDAAVAVGFALGVTHSAMNGLGGGGYILVRLNDGRTSFFDFRERAPGKASRDMFIGSGGRLSPESVTGWRAAADPGNVRGFELAHRKFGTKPWAELLQPAIVLADKGYRISYMGAQAFRSLEKLSKDPESRRIFQKGGAFHEPGDLLLQPELARTLERVAKHGAKDFYEGETARRFAAEMAAHGGLIALEDLKAFAVSESKPLTGRYRGLELITASGSSSGGVGLLQMLGILEESGYEKAGAGSAAAIHFMSETMRRCFADRSESIGDPDFFRIPYERLLDKKYLAALRKSINPDRATPSQQIHAGAAATDEGSDTTHFAVVDAEGNAVAVTFTLNSPFGSGVTVPGLGFVLNNNMDNFAADPGKTNQYGLVQGEANAIQPGKRPVSSMTPTIVVRNGKVYMVVGTPGGPTIVNSVLQSLVNVVDFKMNAQDAVSAPRFHHQWFPDRIFMEPGFSPDTITLLRGRGHEIEFKASNNDMMMILRDGDWLQAGVDPRREGKAAGY